MSNWIDYTLDVLASDPTEINQIAERLKQPSAKLASWVAERDYVWNAVWAKLSPEDWKRHASSTGEFDRREEEAVREFASNRAAEPTPEDIEWLRKLVAFKPVQNLGYVDESINKARRFRNSFSDKGCGIVDSHLDEVSEEFPSAVFLLHFSSDAGTSGQAVIRAGKVIRQVSHELRDAHLDSWIVLPIFEPYWAEHNERLEFGSLWNKWVDDFIAAAQALKHPPATDAKDALAVSDTSPADPDSLDEPTWEEPTWEEPTYEDCDGA